MVSQRRVGAKTSKSRDGLLDAVESLMLSDGYASITYRAVAAKAGVTSGLVQYYFPTLDDVFLAAIRRRSDQNLEHLAALLEARPQEPLRVLWDYSQDESTAALTVEFLALGNHRKSIRSEIAQVSEAVRELQLSALADRPPSGDPTFDGLTPGALLFLITGIPKLVRLERGVGMKTAHRDILDFFEHHLDNEMPPSAAPAAPPRTRRPATQKRSR
ncbi:TetR/AcrR family transcriptional regulator [Aquihabitans sp. McL0605]|uniref:TetR/AcrR family transcriptional regulator n=1 Tax=Aquihabitans sp. McL0605 TaxID=3415671 RepID=UPI003CFAFA46